MTTTQIDDALAQVRRMRELVGDRQTFRGYSGRARLVGGAFCAVGAVVLSMPWMPAEPSAHLWGWGVIAAAAVTVNYFSLAYTLWKQGKLWTRAEILPVIDALPPFAVAGVLTLALIQHGQYDLLFGVWMLLYGLVHVVYRRNLPVANYAVGVWYLVAGTLCALSSRVVFTDPLPMALVFGFGELCGGLVLHRLRDKQEAKS